MTLLSVAFRTRSASWAGRFARTTELMTSAEGRCVAMITWMPAAARLLSEPLQELLDIALLVGIRRQVGVLVEHHDPPGQPIGWRRLSVEARQVAHPRRLEERIPTLHLVDGAFKQLDRVGSVHADLAAQVRVALRSNELGALGIDQMQPEGVRRLEVGQPPEDRFERNGLSASVVPAISRCGVSDELKSTETTSPDDVLADGHREVPGGRTARAQSPRRERDSARRGRFGTSKTTAPGQHRS